MGRCKQAINTLFKLLGTTICDNEFFSLELKFYICNEMDKLRVKIMFVLLTAMGILYAFGGNNLDELDKIIKERSKFEAVKRAQIIKSKADYTRATTDSDRYNTLRTLYKEYRNFRIDSAVIIADERLDIARKWGLKSKVASASINLAESYVKSGLADKAIYILDTLKVETLEDYHRKYRNSVYRSAYRLKSRTELLPSEREEALRMVTQLREQALAESEPGSRGYYTTLAEKFTEAGMLSQAVAKIEKADSIFNFSEDAAMQYTMGEIYLAAGMRQKAIDCLSKAAILDLSSGTKEYQSLILLASLLFEEGDVERAFVYINCALEDMHFSNANFRNPEIMENMPVIDQAFHAYKQENIRITHTFLWIAGVLVLLLAVSVVFLLKTLKSNKRMISTIEDINGRLQDRNQKLTEADKLKLENINTLIISNAAYISRLEKYRKTVYRLVKTGQYENALDALKSQRNNSKDVNAFHEIFDEAFLSMFPDFITSVNKLLKEPLEMKEGNRLTPELRVLALMRLGLSSTEEIARILQYSSQTVYNLRSTIRSLSILPWEDFKAKVKTL